MLLSNAALKNRTTVLVLIVFIALAGTVSYITLPREAAPDVKIPFILVHTVQEGVSPEDVESTITKEIEQELAGLKGLKEFTSTSAEGASVITIEFHPDVEIEDALQRVKDKVDIAKKELPDGAEEPVVSEINIAEMPIMMISVSGPLSPVRLKAIAERLEDEIESVPGVLGVDVHGALEREIRIEMDPDRVAAYGLTLRELLALIPSENVNVSAGGLETEGTKFNVRVPAEIRKPEEVNRLLLAVRNGKGIYLSDVARVRDTFKDRLSYSRLDGRASITVAVRKRIGENIVAIAASVRAILAESRKQAPLGVEFNVVMDNSRDIDMMVRDLENNIVTALVVAVLVLVMGLRTSMIVACAIALSTIGVFVGLLALDLPFGIVMTGVGVISLAGIVVNNAIVLLDYTRRLQKRGMDLVAATVQAGVTRLRPVLLTAGTTILGLVPMVLGVSIDVHTLSISWRSESSQWWRSMATAVIFGLAFATVLTLVVVPSLYVSLYRLAARFGFGGLETDEE